MKFTCAVSAVVALALAVGVTGCGKKETPVVADKDKSPPVTPVAKSEPTPKADDGTAREGALAMIRQRGGKVEVDPTVTGNPVKAVDLAQSKVTDAQLASLKELSEVKKLMIDGSSVSDTGLSHLAMLPNLEELTIKEGVNIGDSGLAHLARLKSLKKLFIDNTKARGDGFRDLASLEALGAVHAGLEDRALEQIGKLTNLRELRLGFNADITDAGLAHLMGLTRLEYLGLYSNSKIGDKGLESLHSLKNLRELWVTGTQVSDRGVAAFKAAVPGCKVER